MTEATEKPFIGHTAFPSVQAIREFFPACRRAINGRPVAYFDGPGGTQVPNVVTNAMVDYLHHHNANTHWEYPASQETDQLISTARALFGQFLNCQPNAIVFGANMTTLTLHLSRALGRRLAVGDEIVVTRLDHHANIDPWCQMAQDVGAIVRFVGFDPTSGQLDWKAFDEALNGRTKLVAVGGASNALGTVNDCHRVAARARDVGALSFIDAVHLASHQLLDVHALDCDFLACSPYKFYGPHAGVLYVRPNLFDELDFPRLSPAGQHGPDRAETGTLSHEAIVGSAAAVDWLGSLAHGLNLRDRLQRTMTVLHQRSHDLFTALWESLGAMRHVTVYGPGPHHARTPTLSFTVDRWRAEAVSAALAKTALFTSHGDFYARSVVETLGLQGQGGLVRLGCACYTTSSECERVIEGIDQLA